MNKKQFLALSILVAVAKINAEGKVFASTAEIATHTKTSISYIEQVVRTLKAKKFLIAKKGPDGGYAFPCNPSIMAVSRIMVIFASTKGLAIIYKHLDSLSVQDVIDSTVSVKCDKATDNQLDLVGYLHASVHQA